MGNLEYRITGEAAAERRRNRILRIHSRMSKYALALLRLQGYRVEELPLASPEYGWTAYHPALRPEGRRLKSANELITYALVREPAVLKWECERNEHRD